MSEDKTVSESTERTVDERIADIRASIAKRTAELHRRATRAREAADLRARIARHPWGSLGISLIAGLVTGSVLARRRPKQLGTSMPAQPDTPSVGRTLFSTLFLTVATTVIKRVATRAVEGALESRSGHDGHARH
jgi:ElaB/YqjD/DUF883 family membrane-anchored ribosome-binding protein